jgi:hypothetical protein
MAYGRRNRSLDTAHFIVFFEGDTVVRVEMRDTPATSPAAPADSQDAKKDDPVAGAAPQG